jgi:antitoxin component of RelBE/YafQ-DinJ toxin-antitoxin module
MLIQTRQQAQQVFDDLATEHCAAVEMNIERILNEKGIALDEPGIDLEQVVPEENPLQFIYHVKKDGVILGTFGLEMVL